MAFVMLAPSLSWPLWLACVFAFVLGLVVITKEPGARRVVGAFLFSLCLAVTFGVVISDEICQAYPWLVECWCKWCL